MQTSALPEVNARVRRRAGAERRSGRWQAGPAAQAEARGSASARWQEQRADWPGGPSCRPPSRPVLAVQPPGGRFSSHKFTAAPISLGLAPVFAPRARFTSDFRYRSVEEDVIDAMEVGCMQGGPWHARKLLGIFLAPLPL